MIPINYLKESEKIIYLTYEALDGLFEYLESDIYITKELKMYLANYKDMLERIQKREKQKQTFLQTTMLSKILNDKYKELAKDQNGAKIALTKDDSKFIFETDAIMSIYEDILETNKLEKSLAHQVKTCIGYWYGFEKCILKL